MLNIDKKELTERFMRYVQIDTQSDPNSNAHPTTEKQKDLSRLLQQELSSMGIKDASVDGTADHRDHPGLKNPTGHIGFLGHGDVVRFKNIRVKKLDEAKKKK